MLRLNQHNIFVRQNILIKLAIMLIASTSAIVSTQKVLIYLLLSCIIYFLVSPVIYKFILKGIRFLLPFFAAYSLFATVFGIDFVDMLVFILRITILSAFVVFFSVSLYLYRFLEDTQFLKQNLITTVLLTYAIATLLFLRSFVSYYKSIHQNESFKLSNLQVLVSRLINAINENWQKRDIIQIETDRLLDLDCIHPVFITRSNILGSIYITWLVLILSL